jgi:microcystin-dependent protein
MEVYLGMVTIFGFTFPPKDWTTCQGQLMSISQNTALFSLLGTTYGGNGQTTFGLPDLRGRVPLGAGQGPGLSSYDIGQVGGSENNTLVITQMPAHNHQATATSTSTSTSTSTLYAESTPANSQNPSGKMLASSQNVYASEDPANNRAMSSEAVTTTTDTTTNTTVTVGIAGSSQPVNNIQPYLAMNYCIALQGIFPSRN